MPAPTELFSELDKFPERIALDVLENWLVSAHVTLDDIRPFIRYHARHYVRNLMYNGNAFQALVLCWRNGQRSRIHDHIGSSCAVKVMHGNAVETLFTHAPNGMIVPSCSQDLVEGSITASQDDDIHQVSNLQPNGADLVTLHLYSPPLLYMNTYSLFDNSVERYFDPINEDFGGGSGI